jgi:hypothetical protein
MRCYICDSALSEVHYNSDHQDYEPCGFCLEIIKDAIGSDVASAREDEFGEDQLTLPLEALDLEE